MEIFNTIIGLFTWQHILIIILIIGLFVGGLFLIKKTIKTEKSLKILLMILGGVLLALLIATRISYVYHGIEEGITVDFFGEERNYNWFMILPNSFCATGALILSIILLFGKYKNNIIIDAIFSIIILGALSNLFYPEYLGRLPFGQFRTFGALIYHILMGFIGVVLIMTNNHKPNIKKWYLPIICYSLILTYGLLTVTVFNFAESFNIASPLIPSLKVSLWYGNALIFLLVDIIIRLIFFFIEKNKKPID